MVDCLLCMSCFSSCFLVCDICFRCSCLAGRLSDFTNNFQKKSVFCSKLCFFLPHLSLSLAAWSGRQVRPTFDQQISRFM